MASNCLPHKEPAGKIPLIVHEVSLGHEELVPFAEALLHQLKSGIVAIGSKMEERCQLLVAVSPDFVQKNIHANLLIKEAAPLSGGGGGGKTNLAQAGGKNPGGMKDALNRIRHLLKDAKCCLIRSIVCNI